MAALSAAAARAQTAFVPGRVLLALAGDGTAANSGMPSSAMLQDQLSASSVAVQLAEHSYNPSTGLFAPTGTAVPLPATAGAPNLLTVLGNVADVGNTNGTFSPWSGSLHPSTDGVVVAMTGYAMPAGTLVGSSSFAGITTDGVVPAASKETNPASGPYVSVPPSNFQRVISWVDSAGTLRTVSDPNGFVNGVLNNTVIHSALWVANSTNGQGWYVTGGNTFLSTPAGGWGGIFWFPAPWGLGGPIAQPVQVCTSLFFGANNYKHWASVFQYNGQLYANRVTCGTGGGVAQFGYFPKAMQVLCNNAISSTTNLVGVAGAGTNNAATQGGYTLHASLFLVDPVSGNTTMYFADGQGGLSVFPQCCEYTYR